MVNTYKILIYLERILSLHIMPFLITALNTQYARIW